MPNSWWYYFSRKNTKHPLTIYEERKMDQKFLSVVHFWKDRLWCPYVKHLEKQTSKLEWCWSFHVCEKIEIPGGKTMVGMLPATIRYAYPVYSLYTKAGMLTAATQYAVYSINHSRYMLPAPIQYKVYTIHHSRYATGYYTVYQGSTNCGAFSQPHFI